MASKRKKLEAKAERPAKKLSSYWFIIPALVVLSFSLWLKSFSIESMSPTFDEPFHLVQAVSFKQKGEAFQRDVHGPIFPIFLSLFVSKAGDFKNLAEFSQNKEKFNGPYQYMLDEFSNRVGDESIQWLRWICQGPWILTVFCICAILFLFNFSIWNIFLVYSVLLLDPALLGITATVSNDVFALALGVIGLYLSLLKKDYSREVALLFFTLSWLTKFNAYLFLFPIGIIYFSGNEQRLRPLLLWLGGAILALCSIVAFNLADISSQGAPSNYRLTYLGHVISLKPLSHYFLQVSMLKLSVVSLLSAIIGIYALFKSEKSKGSLRTILLLIFGYLSASWWLPGLGFRLILVIHILLVVLVFSCLPKTKWQGLTLLLLVLALAAEAFYNKDHFLSYQNQLAGKESRSLDSNTDWGQALKDLVEWRRLHQDGDLALSLFGGTRPEIYGLDDYFKLPSFPELAGGKDIEDGRFSGFVAVSKNFLEGYVIDEYALKILKNKKPVKCFQEALCLYDVREASP